MHDSSVCRPASTCWTLSLSCYKPTHNCGATAAGWKVERQSRGSFNSLHYCANSRDTGKLSWVKSWRPTAPLTARVRTWRTPASRGRWWRGSSWASSSSVSSHSVSATLKSGVALWWDTVAWHCTLLLLNLKLISMINVYLRSICWWCNNRSRHVFTFSHVMFQCRADVHDEMHDMSGDRVAEAYRHDKNHGRLRMFQWNK